MDTDKFVRNTEFLVIDFETITPKGRPPEPIELGMLRIVENEIDRKAAVDFLIKPTQGLHLTKFDTEQTGIKESDLIGKPSAIEVIKRIDRTCEKKDYVFIAQNAKYEANILSHYIEQCPAIAKTPIIDTILLAKHVFPKLQNYKLDTLANELQIQIPRDRHRALPDCVLTAKVFLRLLEMQNQRGKLKNLDELLEVAEIQTSYNKPKQLTFFDFSK